MRNILTDPLLTGWDFLAPVVLSASFWIPAVALLWGVFRGKSASSNASRRVELGFIALGGWTIVVWAYKVIDIAIIDEHPFAFIAVHTVLAAVSTSLAIVVLKGLGHRLGMPSANPEKDPSKGGADAKSGAR